MRCRCDKCHYNEDGFCCQPSYVSIDENGECDQLFVKSADTAAPTDEEGS